MPLPNVANSTEVPSNSTDDLTDSLELYHWSLWILRDAIERSNGLLADWEATCRGKDSITLLCGRG
jgi:hypothetical protein